jgi:predicted nucleotidyltransferase
MSTQKEIEEILRKYKPALRERFKVKEIGVFGSVARGEESEQSDVDILVEFSAPVGWEFVDLKEFLEEILGRQVDLVTVRALKPRLRERILKEVVYLRRISPRQNR